MAHCYRYLYTIKFYISHSHKKVMYHKKYEYFVYVSKKKMKVITSLTDFKIIIRLPCKNSVVIFKKF